MTVEKEKDWELHYRDETRLEVVGLAGIGPATPTLKVSCSTN